MHKHLYYPVLHENTHSLIAISIHTIIHIAYTIIP